MQNKIIPLFLISGLFISACSSTQLNAIRDLGILQWTMLI